MKIPWGAIVEVNCPTCGKKWEVKNHNRGLVRPCRSCSGKAMRKLKHWTSTGVAHGESKTPLYHVWNAMKQRCDVETNESYPCYGGRGISYCDDWKEYLPFRDWALVSGYKKGLYLDRENNDGNYTPGNCRWIKSIVSANNKRNTRNSMADVMAMKMLHVIGLPSVLIARLYGISVDRLADIREKAVWKRFDPYWTSVA